MFLTKSSLKHVCQNVSSVKCVKEMEAWNVAMIPCSLTRHSHVGGSKLIFKI
jgi:hypothetical protein